MTRPKKPIEEISKTARRARLLREGNPKIDEAYKKYQKDSYRKKKSIHRIRKKLKVKEQRDFVIQKLGNKCDSCGEPYNPHSVRTNLEIDHKFYLKDRYRKPETFRQVLNLINSGIDPTLQFNLFCHSCHMIVTHIRKYPQKSKSVLEYLKKTDILKME